MGKLICEVKCRRCGAITEFDRDLSMMPEYKIVHKEYPTERGCGVCKKTTLHDYVSFNESK